jgi:hypothetical protein
LRIIVAWRSFELANVVCNRRRTDSHGLILVGRAHL